MYYQTIATTTHKILFWRGLTAKMTRARTIGWIYYHFKYATPFYAREINLKNCNENLCLHQKIVKILNQKE